MTEWVRPSPCCQVDLADDVGRNDSGDVVSVRRCTSCGNEYPAGGQRMTPAQARLLVAAVRRVPMGPSCYGARHERCNASGCRCRCHDQVVPDAA